MSTRISHNLLLVLPLLLLPLLTACGGSEGGSNFVLGASNEPDPPGTLSMGISDAPVDDVSAVVITIERITFERSGDDVVVETFTSADNELGVTEQETFQVDLLKWQGSSQASLFDEMEIAAGDYSNVVLSIIDDDVTSSYVTELEGNIDRLIDVPSSELRLGGITVDSEGFRKYTIEFSLRKSMTYLPGSEEYILKPRGVRVQDNAADAKISGSVNSLIFNEESPCAEKVDPEVGNVVYLYEGIGLATDDLADLYDPDDSSNVVLDSTVEPFDAVAVIDVDNDGNWSYEFGFIPAGDYTLVFYCNAEGDDAEIYNDVTLFSPTDQITELTVGGGANQSCPLPIDSNGNCGE